MRIYYSWLLLVLIGFAESSFSKELNVKESLQKIYTEFEEGNYDNVISTLDNISEKIDESGKKASKLKGLIYYWKAMSYTKLNDFENAETYFIKALALNYYTKDIYYEYGQVLYVASKYKRARIAFKKSVKANYKVGVSIYYIAFISQELKDYKKAVKFYNMIEKLPEEEKRDVIQAARMQVGDIYLQQIERQRNPFKGVEKYVIPQYKKALSYDEDSSLAPEIKQKIEALQRKYELILFRMRNGKPTSRPPHYLKGSLLYGSNTNATSTTDAVKGNYMQMSAFSRYSIYPSSSFSYAPELSASYTKYSQTDDSILPLNKYYVKGALKMNFEQVYKKRPATFYMDLDYTYNADDTDADKKIEAANNTYGITLSQEVQFWQNDPSTFRIRYENVNAELDSYTNSSYSLSYEQVIVLGWSTLFLYNNYATKTYPNAETSNTNTLTNRIDMILPTFKGLFNPTFYVSNVSTNYVKNDSKGTPNLVTYGINMNRPLGKNLYLTIDYGISAQKEDKDSTDKYDAQLVTFNLDWIY